jgi:MerR family Zn(II)-responsive transcriptional regulator of zntA
MRIGELAEASGTTAKTLRFYEEQGLLPAAERTPAGYRDYTPDAVGRIDFIHRGQAAGLTLAQVRQLRDQAATVEPETCSPDQVCRYL